MTELFQQLVSQIEANIDAWLIVGFMGQFFFFARFLVQWIHSERQKDSVIPIYFWYLSIIGASLVFVYAVVRGDPVFFIGQLFAILIYLRNLQLIKQKRERELMNGQE